MTSALALQSQHIPMYCQRVPNGVMLMHACRRLPRLSLAALQAQPPSATTRCARCQQRSSRRPSLPSPPKRPLTPLPQDALVRICRRVHAQPPNPQPPNPQPPHLPPNSGSTPTAESVPQLSATLTTQAPTMRMFGTSMGAVLQELACRHACAGVTLHRTHAYCQRDARAGDNASLTARDVQLFTESTTIDAFAQAIAAVRQTHPGFHAHTAALPYPADHTAQRTPCHPIVPHSSIPDHVLLQ